MALIVHLAQCDSLRSNSYNVETMRVQNFGFWSPLSSGNPLTVFHWSYSQQLTVICQFHIFLPFYSVIQA